MAFWVAAHAGLCIQLHSIPWFPTAGLCSGCPFYPRGTQDHPELPGPVPFGKPGWRGSDVMTVPSLYCHADPWNWLLQLVLHHVPFPSALSKLCCKWGICQGLICPSLQQGSAHTLQEILLDKAGSPWTHLLPPRSTQPHVLLNCTSKSE